MQNTIYYSVIVHCRTFLFYDRKDDADDDDEKVDQLRSLVHC